MMTTLIVLGILGGGSWYFDHYRAGRRRLEDQARDFGLERMPGESNRDLRRRVVDRATMRYGRR